MSVRNLCLFGTDVFGSSLLDRHTLTFDQLVLANGAVCLLAVPLVLLLPRGLIRREGRRTLSRAGRSRPTSSSPRSRSQPFAKRAMSLAVS